MTQLTRKCATLFILIAFLGLTRTPMCETIQLERQGGIYTVPVRINDQITIGFILDSGASDTQIPADVLLTLFRTHTITSSDFIGSRTYVLADGSKVPSDRFILRELKIGDHVIRDVRVSVGSVAGQPLLGQSFLAQLPSYTIDNKQKTLILSDDAQNTSDQTASMPPSSRTARGDLEQDSARSASLCGHPVDFSLDPNSTDQYSAFVGAWSGTWNSTNHLCGALVVESVDDEGNANIIYVYGPSDPTRPFPWKRQTATAAFRDGLLYFRDDQGSEFKFGVLNQNTLTAGFTNNRGHLSSQFSKLQ